MKKGWAEEKEPAPGDELRGFYLTYMAAEKDMREQAFYNWRVTGEKTMMHRHGPGEECLPGVDGKGGCEWIGPK